MVACRKMMHHSISWEANQLHSHDLNRFACSGFTLEGGTANVAAQHPITPQQAPLRIRDNQVMQFATLPHSFGQLGPAFFTPLDPQALSSPYWVGQSSAMARELGLSDEWMQSNEALQALTGNAKLPGSQPLSSVYSGHQFGQWAGQLGDGRAILLGELTAPNGQDWEIQLKGAGLTPYSRMGDGRAVLRSSIREFLCSEPVTHSARVVVRREEIETAAVVTRCAPSFIRFGHFEHFSYNNLHAELKALADYVIRRYYPACAQAANPYAALLEAVSERTAQMVAQWQAVGFCHGVMNTDNMSILGLTIDYGPFQFLDVFDPQHICNHSDTQGRYSYNRQPNIAYWNLFCLGQALLPLINAKGEQDEALAALEPYKAIFPQQLEMRMRHKLGLAEGLEGDKELIEGILKLLAQNKVDYTIFWSRMTESVRNNEWEPVRDLFLDRQSWDAWLLQYSERLTRLERGLMADLMQKSNPVYVLRNHLGEQAIQKAKLKDFSEVERLLSLLQAPFTAQAGMEAYASFPPDWASTIEISCSS
jgi:serine/tyrosine/threonine adenylyltransferase